MSTPKKPARWRFNLVTMPARGRFEVQVVKEVFRHMPGETYVIEADTGRMYEPRAWRPTPKRRKPRR